MHNNNEPNQYISVQYRTDTHLSGLPYRPSIQTSFAQIRKKQEWFDHLTNKNRQVRGRSNQELHQQHSSCN